MGDTLVGRDPDGDGRVPRGLEAGARVLELGCGAGLAGVAALSRGYRVTFSDICLQAVQVARANALRNGFVAAEAMVLDWYHPPEMTFDILLASDVLYHRASHNCLLQAIEQMLAPDGECWIGDPGRVNAREFFHAASRSFEVHLYRPRGERVLGPASRRLSAIHAAATSRISAMRPAGLASFRAVWPGRSADRRVKGVGISRPC